MSLSRRLSHRLRNSRRLQRAVGRAFAFYFRFCCATTRWHDAGSDELRAALAEGPVILVLWHSRLMLAAAHWPSGTAQLSSLHDTSPMGMIAGASQMPFGIDPVAMSPRASNLATSREVLRRLKAGKSIGLTADGPAGPARNVKDPPLDWARATGRPVFVYAYATARQRRLNSWDRLLMPLPFTRGARVYRRWDKVVPKRTDAVRVAALRTSLAAALDAASAEADRLAGVPTGP